MSTRYPAKTPRIPLLSSIAAFALVVGLPLCAAAQADLGAAPGGDAILRGEPLYSQHKEELIVRHFFGDRRDGIFLDVGAFHWRRWSTTYYLEKHLGWTGVAIDALPEVAEGWRRNRPGAQFFQFIVTDHSGGMETLYGAGGLSSTDGDHLEKFGAGEVKAVEHEIPTITLNDLLKRARIERVDFLSMDIEGGEPAALAGFDIARYQPALVCIEATERIRDEISAYFAAHGYERIDAYLEWDSVNWYFTPSAAAAQPPRAWNMRLVAASIALIAIGGLWALRRQRQS